MTSLLHDSNRLRLSQSPSRPRLSRRSKLLRWRSERVTRSFETLEARWLMSGDPVASPADLVAEQTAGQSINAFGMDLFAQLQSEQGGNLFASPYSAAMALAMAYAGARGETAAQMASVLHLTQAPAAAESAFGALLNDLNSAGQNGGSLLNVADAMWGQQGFPFQTDFLNTIQSDFQGGLKQVDFANDVEAARQEINDWVSQQTHGKIQDLFPQGSLKPTTALVLANAIYMNANWSAPFQANATRDASFTLASGDQISVPTMHDTDSYRYMQRDGFQVLELPYDDGRLAMDVLLPTGTDGLSGLDVNRIPADLNSWLEGLSSETVAVSLPKFKLQTQFKLGPTLAALGMTDAFAHYVADFTDIGPGHLAIDEVLQKAFISVDEKGTEAAAATGVGMVTIAAQVVSPDPITFNADHPFLFLIRDTKTGSVLFTGQVENPTQQGSDSSAPVITHQTKVQEPGPVDPVTPNPPTGAYPTPVTYMPPTDSQDPITGPQAPGSSPSALPEFVGPATPTTVKSAPSPDSGATGSGSGDTLTSNEKFVSALYQKLLGRAVDSGALAHWSQALDQGDSRSSVAQAVESSGEFRRVEVQTLYQHYLQRSADPAGLDFFAAQLGVGETVEQVAAELVGAPEYLAAHGGDNQGFIDALFAAAIGRTADAESQAYFTQQLAAGATREQVAAQIFASSEYQHVLAGALVSKYLDRPAGVAATDYFASQLHAGLRDELAIAEIVASEEFFNDAQAG